MASNDLGGQEVTSMTHANFSTSTNVILFYFCLKCNLDHFLRSVTTQPVSGPQARWSHRASTRVASAPLLLVVIKVFLTKLVGQNPVNDSDGQSENVVSVTASVKITKNAKFNSWNTKLNIFYRKIATWLAKLSYNWDNLTL